MIAQLRIGAIVGLIGVAVLAAGHGLNAALNWLDAVNARAMREWQEKAQIDNQARIDRCVGQRGVVQLDKQFQFRGCTVGLDPNRPPPR